MSSLWQVFSNFKSCLLTTKIHYKYAKPRFLFTCSRFRQLAVPASSIDIKIKNIENIDSSTLRITFSDSNVCSFKNIWLRDSCQCEKCLHPQTKQKLVDIPTLDLNVKPVSLATDTNKTQLKISWTQANEPEPHGSLYSAQWLHQFIPIFSSSAPEEPADILYSSNLPEICFWNREISKQFLPISYDDFMTKPLGVLAALASVYKYGVVMLKDVPRKQGSVTAVANRISFVKETSYGKTFQVKNNPDPKTHLSYTGKRFELHTDLSYMISAPSVQLLHCIVSPNKETSGRVGGESFYADGYFAAEWLRRQHPNHFKLLSTTKVKFTFQDAERGRWYRSEHPLITLDSFGKIKKIYYSGFSMRAPLLPPNKIQPFYEAYQCLSSKLYDISSQWRFYFEPGDLMIFNNMRIVHGRDEYDASKVERHLEGCYMDLEELISLYEHMQTQGGSSN